MSGHPPLSMRSVWNVLFKWKWQILLVFVTCVSAAAVHLLVLRGDLYESEVKILVQRGQEQAPLSTMIVDRSLMVNNPSADVNSEIDLILRDDLITMLVDTLPLDALAEDPPPAGGLALAKHHVKRAVRQVREMVDEVFYAAGLQKRLTLREQMIRAIQARLIVQAGPQTNVVTARFLWPDPVAGAEILNRLIALYLDHRATIFQGTKAVEFFEDRRINAQARLRTLEEELGRFEAATGIVAPEEQKTLLLRQLTQVEADLTRVEQDVQQTVGKIERARGSSGSVAVLGAFDSGSFPSQVMQQLSLTRAELARIRVTRGDSDPSVQRLQRELDTLYGTLMTNIQSVGTERQQQVQLITAVRDRMQVQLDQLHVNQLRWRELQRQIKSVEDDYRFAEARLNEAHSIAALQMARIGSVVVIQHALPGVVPNGIAKTTLLMIATVFGLITALVWATFREMFDTRIHTAGDLARCLQQPVFAAVPDDPRVKPRT